MCVCIYCYVTGSFMLEQLKVLRNLFALKNAQNCSPSRKKHDVHKHRPVFLTTACSDLLGISGSMPGAPCLHAFVGSPDANYTLPG